MSRRGRGRKLAGTGSSLVYYSAIRQIPGSESPDRPAGGDFREVSVRRPEF